MKKVGNFVPCIQFESSSKNVRGKKQNFVVKNMKFKKSYI